MRIELCISLESESSVLFTCHAFVCLSPPSKLKIRCCFLFYLQRADFVQCYTVLSGFRPMEDGEQCHVTNKFCVILFYLLIVTSLGDLVKPPLHKL